MQEKVYREKNLDACNVCEGRKAAAARETACDACEATGAHDAREVCMMAACDACEAVEAHAVCETAEKASVRGRARIRVRIGYAAAAAQGVSGDQAVSCELPDGRFALILSDGMGKGAQAAAESRRLVRRLRGNLKKGMSPARAIKEVNRFMIRPDSFATMDLALLDREMGQAKFYKMGAASSFLVRGAHVRRIDQAALPIGIIPTLKLTHRSAPLALGDIIVMVSDGITEADKEDDEARWLQEILRQIRTGRESAETIVPRRLARKILEEAQQRCGCREHDDLTVLVALVESTR